MNRRTIVSSLLCLVVLALMALTPEMASAQVTTTVSEDQVCTSFKERALMMNADVPVTKGLLTGIYNAIADVVNNATEKLFKAFTNSPTYQYAVSGALTLMVVFYGVGFVIGVVQPSFQQVLIRLVKMSIVFSLISPTGWFFFNDNVVKFFQQGTDDIIIKVQEIALDKPMPVDASPFYALDRIADYLIQPDTIIAIMGAMGAGGPYGIAMGGLMAIAMLGFFKMVLQALSTYAITFVARALVLGVAPIFFIFLLFDRTKNMFVSWLNALINLSLQPILLFTFLSFFIVMIESASSDMLSGSELCWGEFKNVTGSTNSLSFWRFKDPTTGVVVTGDYNFKGSLECMISPASGGGNACQPFPINPVNLLSFLILVYLATRFVEVVKRISSELSNALVGLDSSGRLEQIMQSQNSGPALNVKQKK